MNRTYLYVPPEERAEVEALGAHWDSDAKCWYVYGEIPSTLSRWSHMSDHEEFNIISSDACVASTTLLCPLCGEQTEVICLHCVSGIASEQDLSQFTVFNIRAIDDQLLEELKRWPNFHRSSEESAAGDFANHCARCGSAISDIHLHSEPDQVFFDLAHASDGAIKRTSLAKGFRLSGSEHFVIE
jgi:hypothetical protein